MIPDPLNSLNDIEDFTDEVVHNLFSNYPSESYFSLRVQFLESFERSFEKKRISESREIQYD